MFPCKNRDKNIDVKQGPSRLELSGSVLPTRSAAVPWAATKQATSKIVEFYRAGLPCRSELSDDHAIFLKGVFEGCPFSWVQLGFQADITCSWNSEVSAAPSSTIRFCLSETKMLCAAVLGTEPFKIVTIRLKMQWISGSYRTRSFFFNCRGLGGPKDVTVRLRDAWLVTASAINVFGFCSAAYPF